MTIVVPDDYPTIQAAIDAAAPGDTVFVRAGTYFEHLVVNKQLTLRGEDSATTVIDGDCPGYHIGIDVSADGFVLQGFTVQHCDSGYGYGCGVRVLASQNARIANCRFTENGSGICVCTFYYDLIEHCQFDDNYYGLISTLDPNGMGHVYKSSILSNVFEQNLTGIVFDHDPGAAYNLVQGNIIRNNHGGIYIISASYNDFSYNVFSDNTSYAFYLDICIGGAYFNRIHHNAFLNNNPGGIQAYEAEHAGPDYFNYWYSPDDGEYGEGNFWSDYTSVDADHDGIGDGPYLIPVGYSNDPRPLMHQFVLGDMNLDGAVNAFDIDAFVLALTDAAAYQSQYLQPGELLGDCNFDGLLNAFDVDAFVYRLTHADELPVPPNRPPLAPFNPTPVDGAGGVTAPFLNWSGGDPDTADWVVYDVYFEADNPAPSALVSSGQTDDCWCTGTLQPNTTYYWQIVARDNHGAETAGPIWHFETADSVWSVDSIASDPLYYPDDVSLIMDSTGTAHVCFAGSSLRYGSWTGTEWDWQTVIPSFVSHLGCALDSNDVPHFSYHSTAGLQHTWWSGSAWATETIEATGVGGTAIALDAADRPCIAYIGSGSVKYAFWNGNGWTIEEAASACTTSDLALALDSNDEPHILYCGVGYASRSGGAWSVETVYSGGSNYSGESLVLDGADMPHISFVDGGGDALMYGTRVGSTWSVETISAAGPASSDSCLRLDETGHPHIVCCVYGAAYGSGVVYVEKPDYVWRAETIDTSRGSGCMALALDPDGQPMVVYQQTYDIKSATRTTGEPAE